MEKYAKFILFSPLETHAPSLSCLSQFSYLWHLVHADKVRYLDGGFGVNSPNNGQYFSIPSITVIIGIFSTNCIGIRSEQL